MAQSCFTKYGCSIKHMPAPHGQEGTHCARAIVFRRCYSSNPDIRSRQYQPRNGKQGVLCWRQSWGSCAAAILCSRQCQRTESKQLVPNLGSNARCYSQVQISNHAKARALRASRGARCWCHSWGRRATSWKHSAHQSQRPASPLYSVLECALPPQAFTLPTYVCVCLACQADAPEPMHAPPQPVLAEELRVSVLRHAAEAGSSPDSERMLANLAMCQVHAMSAYFFPPQCLVQSAFLQAHRHIVAPYFRTCMWHIC